MTSETHTPGFACIMQARILNDITDNRLAHKLNNNCRDTNIALLKLLTQYPPHRPGVTQQIKKCITHHDIVRARLNHQLRNLHSEYSELAPQSETESEIINRAYNIAYSKYHDCTATPCTTNIFTRIATFLKSHTK